MFRQENRKPDFNNLMLVLDKKPTPRPVLFDFIIGADKERMLSGSEYKRDTELQRVITTIKAFDSAGYDFAPIVVRGLEFSHDTQMGRGALTKSINHSAGISDRESFGRFVWPELENCDFSIIKAAFPALSEGMKFIPYSVDGILENTTSILGYESLCYLLYDDIDLVSDVFYEVGRRLFSYFDRLTQFDEVGALILNDDWGFVSQTMIDPGYLRTYVFPWYRKIIEAAHARGKAAILHSCGNYSDILNDIIDMGFDGRHSYEDKIVPVEQAYEDLQGRIAVLGGIDVGFMSLSSPEEVYKRCKDMLNRTCKRGGYALGSGNSIPDYVPNENYKAMLRAANEAY